MRRSTYILAVSWFLLALPGNTASPVSGGLEFDIVLKDATVVDGTGKAPFQASVGVRNGRIAVVGSIPEYRSRRVVDAKGFVVAPGFIDLLCHNGHLWSRDMQLQALRQGVTSAIAGNCGFSVLFVGDNLKRVGQSKPLMNLGTFIAHGTIRDRVVKMRKKTLASPSEMAEMKRLLETALREGCFGLSSGLGYEPGEWTDPAELQDLASVLTRFPNTGYYTHLRNFRSEVLAAIEEAVLVARATKVPVVIQHLLFKLPGNWGSAEEGLRRIRRARTEGLDLYATVYPYDFWGNEVQIPLVQMLYLRPEMLQGGYYNDESRFEGVLAGIRKRLDEYGGADAIEITSLDPNMPRDYLGRRIGELARVRGLSEEETVLALLLENRKAVKVCYHGLSEKALELEIRTPFVLFGSDSSEEIPHPRNSGAYSRVFAKYVREKRVISIQEAVRKATSEPARLLGFKDRGLVKAGYWADLVVFEPRIIEDAATPVSPALPPKGVRLVIVNGKTVVERNRLTGETPGMVLRRQDR